MYGQDARVTGTLSSMPARRTVLAVVIGLAIGVAVMVALRPVPTQSGKAISPLAERSAEWSLDRRIPEVWLVDVPLDEAARRVGEFAGVPVVIDTKAVDGDSV